MVHSLASTGTSAAVPPQSRLRLAACSGQAGEYRATLEDRVVLDVAFLDPARSEDENVRLALAHQLRYIWGYIRNNPDARTRNALVLSAEDPTFEILSLEHTTYGRDLVLDWHQTARDLQITDAYTAAAVERGATHATDPALVVRYRARFKVALCGESRPERSTLDVVLPVDPWLAYWHVPAARRRLMRFFDDTAVTNPCSDDDFADLPHPIYYWYDWLPDRHGLDGAGQPFDCREWLKEGADYFTRPLSLERLAAPIGRFDEQAWASLGDVPGGPRATVLLGVLDHAWPDLALASLRREIGESGRDPAARARTALRQSKPRERASQKLLRLLADLAEVMVVHRYETRVDAGYLEVALHGKLRHSHWPFHLRVFLGLTDIFGPAAPSHWGILRRALAEDDIVIYAGHSGIGENVRLAQIEEHLQLPHGAFVDQYRRRRRQIVAFLSCYSYMYFGQDLVRAFGDNDAFAREFIYTGSGFTSGDRGALSVIDVVDRVLERGDVQTMRFLAPEDFLLWESLSR